MGAFRAGFQGTVTINRRDWRVSWNAVLEGGGALVSNKGDAGARPGHRPTVLTN